MHFPIDGKQNGDMGDFHSDLMDAPSESLSQSSGNLGFLLRCAFWLWERGLLILFQPPNCRLVMHASFGTFSDWGAGVHRRVGSQHPSMVLAGTGFLRGHCLVRINSREMGMNFPCPPQGHPEARPGVWQGTQVVLEHPRTSQGKGPAPAPPAALGSGPGGMLPAIAQAFLGDLCLQQPASLHLPTEQAQNCQTRDRKLLLI